MTPNKPYLIRAIFEWILENNCTPHILVATEFKHVIVPTQFIQGGKIVLNISPTAVAYLVIANDLLTFNARFGGVPMDIQVPIGAILAIYAMENGEGSGFELYETELLPSSKIDKISPISAAPIKSKFTVLDHLDTPIDDPTDLSQSPVEKPVTKRKKKPVQEQSSKTESIDATPPPKTTRKNKTTLKVIK